MDQPSFHPVTLNVFPALPIVTVRSHIPGSVAEKKPTQLSVLGLFTLRCKNSDILLSIVTVVDGSKQTGPEVLGFCFRQQSYTIFLGAKTTHCCKTSE